VNFAPGKIPLRGNSHRKCIYSLLAQITAKHRAKFGWLPLSDIAAVTKPRRESHWNQLECPKLPDRSQPLVHRSFPYCENMWRRYCCLTSFFSIVDMCLSCEDIGLQSCAMVPRWRFFGDFCVLYFIQPRAARFRPAYVEAWQTSSLRRLRLGEKKKDRRKKKPQANIYGKGLPYSIGRP